MPGFVVLGVRPGRIEQRARVLVKAQERRLKKCPTPASTETRFAKAVARVRAAPPDRTEPRIQRAAVRH